MCTYVPAPLGGLPRRAVELSVPADEVLLRLHQTHSHRSRAGVLERELEDGHRDAGGLRVTRDGGGERFHGDLDGEAGDLVHGLGDRVAADHGERLDAGHGLHATDLVLAHVSLAVRVERDVRVGVVLRRDQGVGLSLATRRGRGDREEVRGHVVERLRRVARSAVVRADLVDDGPFLHGAVAAQEDAAGAKRAEREVARLEVLAAVLERLGRLVVVVRGRAQPVVVALELRRAVRRGRPVVLPRLDLRVARERLGIGVILGGHLVRRAGHRARAVLAARHAAPSSAARG